MSIQVLVVAAFFLAIGLYAIVRPAKVYQVFGVQVDSADGRNEIRAVYGGMCLAIASILVLGPFQGVYLAVAVLLTGMAAGRIVSLAIERTSFVPIVFLVSEVLGAVLLMSVVDLKGLAYV